MTKIVFVLLFIVSSLYSTELVSRQKVMMGTFIILSVASDKEHLLQKGFNTLKEVDNALSSFNPKADIYRLNEQKQAAISSMTYEALHLSKQFYMQSDGYFNITVGSLTKDVYKFGSGFNESITPAQLDRESVNFKGLHVKKDSASLDKGIKVDLGGMGKGFGVDKVYDIFKKANVSHAIIKLSGDIKCISTCKIAITDPFKEESTFATFTTKKHVTAISTSGNYRNYIQNKKQNHLINPKTKRSQREFASITLISEGLNSELDAMATAVMVMPKKVALSFLKEHDFHYILVDNNKNIYTSNNLDDLIEVEFLYMLK